MPHKKKGVSRKVYVATSFLIILVIATAAIIYAAETYFVSNPTVGVKVGDTFIYALTGTVELISIDAVTPANFQQFNDTDYYKVTVTAVKGTWVSLATEWRFQNGTSIDKDQQIDLPSGKQSDAAGFWAIYPSNINKNGLLRPAGNDGVYVNGTNQIEYIDSNRQADYWSLQHELIDANDPTHTTALHQVISVYFDKQTGMLISLVDMQEYSNPQLTTIISWRLVSSTVWAVQ